MAARRVLFFGVTGVDKKNALVRLRAWARDHLSRDNIACADFDSDYLFNAEKGGLDWYAFLNDTYENQRARWANCWARFSSDFANSDGDLFVGMHGCVVRGHYGVRWLLDARAVAEDLRPDLIVVLLDEVYDMWWRTEQRAGGEDYRGRPTLEQLIFARRAEQMVADQVAHASSATIPVFMVSVSHPSETLARRIFSNDPRVVYLAFPISAPRKLLSRGSDDSGIEEINGFLEQAYAIQHSEHNLVVTCPLGIDELPLVVAMDDTDCHETSTGDDRGESVVRFDREVRRWNLSSVWPPDRCLSSGPPVKEYQTAIPLEQLRAAAGLIKTDVGWRDYRLVDQATYLVAFNPVFKNQDRVSRSVYQEINFFASGKGRPAYVVQEQSHDPNGVLDRIFPPPGTMQEGPGAQMVVRKDQISEAFDAIGR